MAEKKSYRHRVTGLVDEYEAGIAAVFVGVLTEVESGAKPLAYLPINPEAVAAVLADSEPDEGDADENTRKVK